MQVEQMVWYGHVGEIVSDVILLRTLTWNSLRGPTWGRVLRITRLGTQPEKDPTGKSLIRFCYGRVRVSVGREGPEVEVVEVFGGVVEDDGHVRSSVTEYSDRYHPGTRSSSLANVRRAESCDSLPPLLELVLHIRAFPRPRINIIDLSSPCQPSEGPDILSMIVRDRRYSRNRPPLPPEKPISTSRPNPSHPLYQDLPDNPGDQGGSDVLDPCREGGLGEDRLREGVH